MPDANPPTGEQQRWGGRGPETVRVVRALRHYANELERYVGAAGHEAEMHRTDLSGLAMVMERAESGEHPTPGHLSAHLGLSAPATSALLDRLERLGHVERHPHPSDRRSVVVEATAHAREVGSAMFTPLAEHLDPVLADRSDDELRLIADFLEAAAVAARAARAQVGGAGPAGPR